MNGPAGLELCGKCRRQYPGENCAQCEWRQRAEKAEAARDRAREQITGWETASGLITSAGDPDGITPEQAQKHWEAVGARAERFHGALVHAIAIEADYAELRACLVGAGIDPAELGDDGDCGKGDSRLSATGGLVPASVSSSSSGGADCHPGGMPGTNPLNLALGGEELPEEYR